MAPALAREQWQLSPGFTRTHCTGCCTACSVAAVAPVPSAPCSPPSAASPSPFFRFPPRLQHIPTEPTHTMVTAKGTKWVQPQRLDV